MVCFYDVVAIATQAEFIPQLKQRVFFHLFYKQSVFVKKYLRLPFCGKNCIKKEEGLSPFP